MKRGLLLISVFGLSLFGNAFAGVEDAASLPWVTDSGRDAYKEKFLPEANHKAFAISQSGRYAWSVKKESRGRAAQFALYNCLKGSQQKCMLYAVDDKLVLDTYQSSATEANTAIANLKPPAKKTYADEDKDFGVAPIAGLKSGKLHESTPTSAPFAKIVTTASLVELLAAPQKPFLLDVLAPDGEFRKRVIPSAAWVSGAGIFDDKANDRIDDFFAKFMTNIAPAKDTPIVAYCLNRECWLSYNALQRLSKFGYSNLYWYRGGIEAWEGAGLSTVEVPLAAQVY